MRQDIRFRVEELLATTHGQRLCGSLQQRVLGVTTDTRELRAGDLFIALKGERFDGHDFLGDAIRLGVSALLVDSRERSRLPSSLSEDSPVAVVAVEDTRLGLGRLARYQRQRYQPAVVAITGSNGKTGTKELTAAALAAFGPTLRTTGNLNNEIGLPLCLLGLGPEHEYAVLELGMNHPGEITNLAALALPRVGVITNVAAAHTEGLGSREGVARAKGELFEAIPRDGLIVVNLDEPLVLAQTSRSQARQISFGASEQARVRVINSRSAGGKLGGAWGDLLVDGWLLEVHLRLLGRHNVFNAAAALAVCLGLTLDPERAMQAMGEVRPSPHRMELREVRGLTLLDDCYNANPGSMQAALTALQEIAESRPAGEWVRCGAVLGEMRELGGESVALHQEVGRLAAAQQLEFLLTVGEGSWALGEAAVAAGQSRWYHLDDASQAAARLLELTRPGDLVLLKGSRRVGLERVVTDLQVEAS